ncbi:undecaprenyl-phosphate 4-deoxy-4-formamido-L-arabinose transferase, partial [Proteus mirabilis]|nr:undecaprenyl-phosphate 4-deoxy-4-formamido-L-arabinose transferase [Proteus mirabilis]
MSTFEKINKVSVVIPVYNEEESLPQLLERTIKSCKQLEQEYELI